MVCNNKKKLLSITYIKIVFIIYKITYSDVNINGQVIYLTYTKSILYLEEKRKLSFKFNYHISCQRH